MHLDPVQAKVLRLQLADASQELAEAQLQIERLEDEHLAAIELCEAQQVETEVRTCSAYL